MKPVKCCLVTPDIVGPVRNGGIGTYCDQLMRLLVARGWEVTVLFTARCETGSPAAFRDGFLRQHGVRFVATEELAPAPAPELPPNPAATTARTVLRFLTAEQPAFDLCFFQDWQAHGFAATEARSIGSALPCTRTVVLMHGSSLWQRQGMRALPWRGLADVQLDHLEACAARRADEVVAPSQHMLDWTRANGWSFDGDTRVLPTMLEGIEPGEQVPLNRRHLVFFGRLETRKGLELLVTALDRLRRAGPLPGRPAGEPLRVTFLGKPGVAGGTDAETFLDQAGTRLQSFARFETLTTLDHHDALGYLRGHMDALVLCPSLGDNLPFTVLEASALGCHLLATRVGGITEIFQPGANLPEPEPGALANAIARAFSQGECRPPARHSPAGARQAWHHYLDELEHRCQPPANPAPGTTGTPSAGKPEPKASAVMTAGAAAHQLRVIVPFYNAGPTIGPTLECLAAQELAGLRVTVIDDGSDDPGSLHELGRLRGHYAGRQPHWTFMRQDNSGPSAARNHAARSCAEPLLAFVDSDNLPYPDMASSLLAAIGRTGADAITCHSHVFHDRPGDPSDSSDVVAVYAPTGGPLVAGLFDNVFGDTNMIIRRESLFAAGGFNETVRGVEDWLLLFRLAAAGHDLRVLPRPLFRYRVRQDGVFLTSQLLDRHQPVIEAAAAGAPSWIRSLLEMNVGQHLTLQSVCGGVDQVKELAGRLDKRDARIGRLSERIDSLRAERDRLKQRLKEARGQLDRQPLRRFEQRLRRFLKNKKGA